MSTPTSGDLLLVSRGGVNYQIDYNDMSTLQDTDLLLVSRDGVNYKIEAQDLGLAPKEITAPVEVVTPLDGAGDPDLIYLKSDTITAVESSGILTCETDLIQNVDNSNPSSIILSFPTSNGFDCFEPGQVVQSPLGFFDSSTYLRYSAGGQETDYSQLYDKDYTSLLSATNPAYYIFNNGGYSVPSGVGVYVYYTHQNNTTATWGCTVNGQTAISPQNFGSTQNSGYIQVAKGPIVINTIGPNRVGNTSNNYMTDIVIVENDTSSIGNRIVYNNISSWLAGSSVRYLSDGSGSGAVTSKDPNAYPPTITVNGGNWEGSNGSGTSGEQTTLVKDTYYDIKLTLAGSTDLALMSLGSAVMTDGVLGGTGYSQTSYNLTTSQISNIGTYNIYTVALSGSNLNSGQYISSMFDGNLGTYFAFYDGGSLHNLTGSFTITFTEPIENVTSLKLATAWASSTSKTVSIQINGYNATVTNLWDGTGNIPLIEPIMNSGSIPTQITSITIFADYNPATLAGIEVNGNLLIYPPQPVRNLTFTSPNKDLKYFQVGDNLGTSQIWDKSKTWSNLITSIYSDHTGNTNAFNGVVDRSSAVITSTSVSSVRWIQCATNMAVNGRVRVMTSFENSDTAEISVTSGSSTTVTTGGPDVDADGWIDFGIHTGNLNYVKVTKGNNQPYAGIAAIEVNRLLLVDSTVSGTGNISIEVNAVDINANTMTVNASSYEIGDTITLSTNGGVGNIVHIDETADKIYLTSTGGSLDRWIADNNAGTAFAVAAGSVNNPPAPTAAGATFTSSNAGTTAYSGTESTLASRTWTLETASSKTGPWTLVNTYTDTDPVSSQDGATAWTTNRPTLSADTWYRVKVAYNAAGADSVESEYHTFKTAV